MKQTDCVTGDGRVMRDTRYVAAGLPVYCSDEQSNRIAEAGSCKCGVELQVAGTTHSVSQRTLPAQTIPLNEDDDTWLCCSHSINERGFAGTDFNLVSPFTLISAVKTCRITFLSLTERAIALLNLSRSHVTRNF